MPTDTLLEHSTREFSTNWIHRVQQTAARLDAFVEDHTFMGDRKRFDRLASQTSRKKTERKAPTTIVDVDMDSRWAYREYFELANLLDEDDAQNLGQLVLPQSDYVRSHAMAYARDCDDIAWKAALGAVKTGEDGTTSTAFLAAQQVAAGGTGLTLAKLLTVKEILNTQDVEDGAGVVGVVGAQQITNLLNTTEVKSADYNTVKALASGQIDTFMGIKFVVLNRLTKVSTTRSTVFWVKGAIKRTKGQLSTRISLRNDLSDATQIRSTWHLGATRVYDEGVVQVDCIES